MIGKVLLVDDENDFVKTLSERMQTRGLKVETAENGRAAIEKVKEKEFDAVILDLSMPDMNGIETLKELLKEKKGIQVIMLTGRATVEKGVESIKLGALDFLEKPVDIERLLEKIKEARANKIVIMEKGIEEKVKDILGKKGW